MDKILFSGLYVAFGIIIVLIELLRNKNKKIDLLTVVNIGYLFIFVLIPILVINMEIQLYNTDINDDNKVFIGFLLSILAYIGIISGYYFKNLGNVIINNSSLKKIDNNYSISEANIRKLAIFTFIISSLSLIIYTIKLGGITNTLKSAEIYRMYGSEQISGSFIKVFFPLIVASCNLYYILKIDYKDQKRYSLMFYVALVFSLYYLIINAGRMPIFIFIATFIVFKVLKDKKVKYMIPTIIIGIIIVQYLDVFFGYLSFGADFTGINTLKENKPFSLYIEEFIGQFSFPYLNILNVSEFAKDNFRMLSDYIMSIIQFLPDGIFYSIGLGSPQMLHEFNTLNHGANAGIPVDIVTYGYYQVGILGIIIHTFIFGNITRFLNNISERKGDNIYIFLRAKLIILWGFNVMYSDIDTFIRGKLDLIIIILFIIILSKENKFAIQNKESYNN